MADGRGRRGRPGAASWRVGQRSGRPTAQAALRPARQAAPAVQYACLQMAGDLQRRGSYTPRRVREQRAYRLVVAGSVAGVVGVAGVVLAVVGVVSSALPIIALLIAAVCAFGFVRMVGSR